MGRYHLRYFCITVIQAGFCPQEVTAYTVNRLHFTIDLEFTVPHSPLYSSKKWRDLRATQLRLHPHCCICKLVGVETRATEVDHILAVAAGGYPFALSNLRSKCKSHHSQKTIMIDGQHRGSGALVTTGLDGFPVLIEGKQHGNP